MQGGASQTCQETFCGCGKDVSLFQKGQLLALIKQRKQEEMLKLLKLGWELSNTLLNPGRMVVDIHLQGQKNILNGCKVELMAQPLITEAYL